MRTVSQKQIAATLEFRRATSPGYRVCDPHPSQGISQTGVVTDETVKLNVSDEEERPGRA